MFQDLLEKYMYQCLSMCDKSVTSFLCLKPTKGFVGIKNRQSNVFFVIVLSNSFL